jgi:hypothetical protein
MPGPTGADALRVGIENDTFPLRIADRHLRQALVFLAQNAHTNDDAEAMAHIIAARHEIAGVVDRLISRHQDKR